MAVIGHAQPCRKTAPWFTRSCTAGRTHSGGFIACATSLFSGQPHSLHVNSIRASYDRFSVAQRRIPLTAQSPIASKPRRGADAQPLARPADPPAPPAVHLGPIFPPEPLQPPVCNRTFSTSTFLLLCHSVTRFIPSHPPSPSSAQGPAFLTRALLATTRPRHVDNTARRRLAAITAPKVAADRGRRAYRPTSLPTLLSQTNPSLCDPP